MEEIHKLNPTIKIPPATTSLKVLQRIKQNNYWSSESLQSKWDKDAVDAMIKHRERIAAMTPLERRDHYKNSRPRAQKVKEYRQARALWRLKNIQQKVRDFTFAELVQIYEETFGPLKKRYSFAYHLKIDFLALCKEHDLTLTDIKNIRKARHEEKGPGFDPRVYFTHHGINA